MAQTADVVRPVMRWENQAAVTSVHVGRKSGECCAVGTAEGVLHLWAMRRGPQCRATLNVVQTGALQAVHLDNWEKRVFCGAASGTMKIIDVESERIAESFLTAHRTAVTAIASHPMEANHIVTGSLDSTVKYWDTRSAQPLQVLKGMHGGITALGVSPDGRWIASGDENGKLSYVDIRKWRPIADFQCHGAVTCIRMHPLELLLAAGTSSGVVEAFDVGVPPAKSYTVQHSNVHAVWAVELLPGEHQDDYMVSCGPDSMRVHLSQTQLASFDVPWEGKVLDSVYLDGVQQTLHASADRHQLTVWSTPTASLSSLAKSHRGGGGGGRGDAVVPAAHHPPHPAPSSSSAPVPEAIPAPGRGRNDAREPAAKPLARSPSYRRGGGGGGSGGGSAPPGGHVATRFHLIRNPEYAGRPIVPAEPSAPLELNLAKWRTSGRDRSALHLEKTELQLAKEIHTTGAKMERLLRNRAEALKIVRGLWANGDRTGAIVHAERAGHKDFGILVDLLSLTASNHSVKESIQAEQCMVLLPLAQALIAQGIDPSALVAIRVVRFLHNKFIPAALRTLTAPAPIGVDVAFAERLHRAKELRKRFLDVRKPLADLLGGRPSAVVAEEGHQVLRDLDAVAQGA
eukprot:TRINITY_DN1424_c0_g2_i1.p1 TRINITY_DN1424_c0_g2~~TRINITY_DN1424_c0_g2_i1.p1  ORF type:complete len:628 (+),score=184.22 TRINITY_DN1424_c0_g2_i1:62-1945(+)